MDLVRRFHQVDGNATKITDRKVVIPRRSHKMSKFSRRKVKKMAVLSKQFLGKGVKGRFGFELPLGSGHWIEKARI